MHQPPNKIKVNMADNTKEATCARCGKDISKDYLICRMLDGSVVCNKCFDTHPDVLARLNEIREHRL